MKQSVASLMAELIELDPSLADKQDDLKRLVQSMLDAKPDTNFRSEFSQELLMVLRTKMAQRSEGAPHPTSYLFSLMNNRFLFAGGGAVLGALLVFVVLQQPVPSSQPTPEGEAFVSTTEDVGRSAFGSLSASDALPGLGAGDESANRAARPQSGGGGGGGISAAYVDGDAAKMIAPAPDYEYKQTQYVFDGEITLPEGDVEVLKRIKPDTKISAGSSIGGFASGLIDWSALGSMNVQNVSLVTSGRDAYTVYIDYSEGTLSVNKTIDTSLQPWNNCSDDNCYERYRLKEADMIPDDEALSIARGFAERLGIDLSNYGDPVVVDEWRVWLMQAEDRSSFYYPEQMTVTFPMLIDGKPVYEEYGNMYGVSIGVDIRSKTATNLYGYSLHNFQKSAYAAVTDEEKLRAAMKHGSVYYWVDPNATYVDAQLSAPTEGYMHHYLWDQKTGTTTELFVPALIFPVTVPAEGTYDYRKNVVVPLADELLKAPEDQPVPMPRPMPLMEDDPAVSDLVE